MTRKDHLNILSKENYTYSYDFGESYRSENPLLKISFSGSISSKDIKKALYKVNQYASTEIKINSVASSDKRIKNDFISRQREKTKQIADDFLGMLKNDIVDMGYHSNSELFFKARLNENPSLAKEWLNEVFLNNFGNYGILVKILYIISGIEYEHIQPQGPTMAMAASLHENPEVKEFAVRAFENWENPEMLLYLHHIKFEEDWLQGYLQQVIDDLEEV